MPKRLKFKYHVNYDIPSSLSEAIFVFGSNLAGLHSRSSPLIARTLFGAEQGTPMGYMGRSYAIPVRDRFINLLSIREIQKYVAQFAEFTHNRPDLYFWVTAVGCGHRKYKHHEIARLFIDCNPKNCTFPVQWKPYLR